MGGDDTAEPRKLAPVPSAMAPVMHCVRKLRRLVPRRLNIAKLRHIEIQGAKSVWGIDRPFGPPGERLGLGGSGKLLKLQELAPGLTLGDSRHTALHPAYANPQIIAVMGSTMRCPWLSRTMRSCERGGVKWAPKFGEGPKGSREAWKSRSDQRASAPCIGGGRGRNRTFNLSVKSRMLCQLSYASL